MVCTPLAPQAPQGGNSVVWNSIIPYMVIRDSPVDSTDQEEVACHTEGEEPHTEGEGPHTEGEDPQVVCTAAADILPRD